MMTFSKPLNVVKPQGNGPQKLKSIILIECPNVHKLTKGDYQMYKLRTVPYNTNSPTYDLAVPFLNTRSVEEWLKFWHNLEAVITRQNITDPQGMYTTTKSMLREDALIAFKNTKGVNRPQSELVYKNTMVAVHMHMFPLQAYITQTRYMNQTLMKHYNMSLCTFVVCVNKMNDCLEEFPSRDNRTPQVTLMDDKLMDILENAVPKSWQEECIDRDLTAWPKDFPKSLDPPKLKNRQNATSATGCTQQILRKKRGQEADAPNLTENQA
eukprot:6878682-Ditylum_brightwellii.AAC.1